MSVKSPYSVRGIAEQVGVSKSTVHRWFQKKQKAEAEADFLESRREALRQYLDGPAGAALLDLASFEGGLQEVRDWLARVEKGQTPRRSLEVRDSR